MCSSRTFLDCFHKETDLPGHDDLEALIGPSHDVNKVTPLRKTPTQAAYQYTLLIGIWSLAFAMTLPGMVNAFCAPSNSAPEKMFDDMKNMSAGMLALSIFVAFCSSSINTLMNKNFLFLAKDKLNNSIKPIREEIDKGWDHLDGKKLSLEIAKTTSYLGLAGFAGVAAGAISYSAFGEIPEPWGMRASIFFGLLNTLNTAIVRFTGLPGLMGNIQERHKKIKEKGFSKQDMADIVLSLLAAASVYALFTQSGFKGVNIITSEIKNDPNGLTHLSPLEKIATGTLSGLVSSAFYANNLLDFTQTAQDTFKHIKEHKHETAPLIILIVLAGFTGALLANVNSNIINNDNQANPNGNIFGFEPNLYGYGLTLAIFLFATMVNIKVIAKSHIDTPPEMVRGLMKRVQSVGDFFRKSRDGFNVSSTQPLTHSV